jgi:predicted RNA-binding protein with PIN domain
MRYDWLIIDGYSLLHREPRLKKYIEPGRLELGRDRLVRLIEAGCGQLAQRISVIFDGKGAGAGCDLHADLLEVIYSPGHLTADSVIERLVLENRDNDSMCVVSNDRAVLNTVTGAGAFGMSCGQFLELIERVNWGGQARNKAGQSNSGSAKLGDFFPG